MVYGDLGKKLVMCGDGKHRECWSPATNDMLAGIQAEHTIPATATGKIVGRVMSHIPSLEPLAGMLLGGTVEKPGESKGSRDMCGRALLKSAINALLEFARSLMPTLEDGRWVRKHISMTFDGTILQPSGRKVVQVNVGSEDEVGKLVHFPVVRSWKTYN